LRIDLFAETWRRKTRAGWPKGEVTEMGSFPRLDEAAAKVGYQVIWKEQIGVSRPANNVSWM